MMVENSSYRLVLGLTGGIASGKSTVTEMFRQRGCPIVDSDLIAREIVMPGRPAWRKIGERFGPEVYTARGEIDRAKLGSIIFGDQRARADLNRIMHPEIIRQILDRIANLKSGDEIRQQPDSGAKSHRLLPIIVDIPLLYEEGLQWMVDGVVLVYVPPHIQIKRLMERDGLGQEDARARIDSQMSIDHKRSLADYTIDNSGGVDDTRMQFENLWEEVTGY